MVNDIAFYTNSTPSTDATITCSNVLMEVNYNGMNKV